MTPVLIPVAITKSDLDILKDFAKNFSCGQEPHQLALAQWLRQDAEKALKDKTSVWLYALDDEARPLIGFGSLGKSNWVFDDGPKKRVQIIPALAVDQSFQGRGFCHQIVDHLLNEAKQRIHSVSPILGLFVHEKNPAAIHIYQKRGFKFFPLTHTDETGKNLSMTYELAIQ